MENLKPYLEAMKKHHFWVLTALFMLIVLYGWYAATGAIEKQFASDTSKVNRAFRRVVALRGQREFPNDQWTKATEEKSQEVVDQIGAASRRIRKSQTPGLRLSELYSDEAIEEIRTTPSADWSEDTEAQFREAMPLQPDELRKMMGAAEGPNDPGVRWDAENFDTVKKAFEAAAKPEKSKLDLYQKALWLYENMASIIARTNARAPDKFNLPLHTIEALNVRQAADLDAKEWSLIGMEPTSGDLKARAKTRIDTMTQSGYEVFPVRMRLRMELRLLPQLLSECANSDLPFMVQGVRLAEPSRLVKIQPPKRIARRRPGFGNRNPIAPVREKEPEQEAPAPGSGSLVEIWGLMYFAAEKEEKSNEA